MKTKADGYAVQDKPRFIAWYGGRNPVPGLVVEAIVKIVPWILPPVSASYMPITGPSESFIEWRSTDPMTTIIAYRVIEEPTAG